MAGRHMRGAEHGALSLHPRVSIAHGRGRDGVAAEREVALFFGRVAGHERVRDPRRCVAGSDRERDDASADRNDKRSAVHGGANSDAVTHTESDRCRRFADTDRDDCRGQREPLFRGRGKSTGDRCGQRHELPALRDADRDRLPRSALAFPVAGRPAPLGRADLHEPRDEQRDRLDEVVEEVQVRSRDRKTAEDNAA